jgi:hypothetical protein
VFPVWRLVLTLWLGFNLTLVCQGHASAHGPRQTEPHIAFLGEPAGEGGGTGAGVGSDPGRSQPAYATTASSGESLPAVVHMVQTEQGAIACPAPYILCDSMHGRVCSRMVCGPDPPPPRA